MSKITVNGEREEGNCQNDHQTTQKVKTFLHLIVNKVTLELKALEQAGNEICSFCSQTRVVMNKYRWGSAELSFLILMEAGAHVSDLIKHAH